MFHHRIINEIGVWVALLCLVSVTIVLNGCSSSQAKPLTWDSERMQNLELQLKESIVGLHPYEFKDDAATMYREYEKILRNNLNGKEIAELIDSCKTMPALNDNKSPDQRLLCNVLLILNCDYSDRELLVRMLAIYCPDSFLGQPVEARIAFHGPNPDALLILPEAYKRSQSLKAKEIIANSLRRSVVGIVTCIGNDDLFVKEYVDWYNKEGDKYELNPEYVNCPAMTLGKLPMFIRVKSR